MISIFPDFLGSPPLFRPTNADGPALRSWDQIAAPSLLFGIPCTQLRSWAINSYPWGKILETSAGKDPNGPRYVRSPQKPPSAG